VQVILHGFTKCHPGCRMWDIESMRGYKPPPNSASYPSPRQAGMYHFALFLAILLRLTLSHTHTTTKPPFAISTRKPTTSCKTLCVTLSHPGSTGCTRTCKEHFNACGTYKFCGLPPRCGGVSITPKIPSCTYGCTKTYCTDRAVYCPEQEIGTCYLGPEYFLGIC